MELLDDFSTDNKHMGKRLIILLRLAVLLSRSRHTDNTEIPHLKVHKKNINLSFSENWLDDHPLTQSDLQNEQACLDKAGYKLEYR